MNSLLLITVIALTTILSSVPSNAIRCYVTKDEHVVITDGYGSCFGAFSKGQNSTFYGRKYPVTFDKECMRETLVYNTVDRTLGYVCHCLTELCNFPYSWAEFEHRNLTMAPLIGQVKTRKH